MNSKDSFGSTISGGIGIIVIVILIGIPGYFLWDTIKDIFLSIPSNRIEFKNLLETSHGVIFYIFAGIVTVWGLLFNVIYRFLMSILLILKESSWKNRCIGIGFSSLFIVTGALPYLTYLFISKNLYGYYFDFHQMLMFIGTFELMLLFVSIFEAFIGTQIIAPITRIVLYSFLIFQFI